MTTSAPSVDTSMTCTPDSTITPDNVNSSLWYYRPDTKELFIPVPNAQAILHYLYKTTVTVEVAQAWLRTLEFNKRHVRTETCSLYTGVTFIDCEPLAGRSARCVVLNASINDEQEATFDEVGDMIAKAEAGDLQYGKPNAWRNRRNNQHITNTVDVPQLDRLTRVPSPNQRSKVARYAHANRMAKLYGRDTQEYQEAMRAYDNGERRPRGRHSDDNDLKQKTQIKVAEYVRRLAHPQVNIFYGDLSGANRSGDIRLSDAPITYPASLLAPTRFHTNTPQATYDVTTRPIAWAIETREVRVPMGANTSNEHYEVRTQVTKVAIVEAHLAKEMANYAQAQHYVGTRQERNPVTHHKENCAIFDIDHYGGKRPVSRAGASSKPSVQTQLDDLTNKMTEMEAKMDRLGKAMHALMGIVKEMG
jgi:hypothetical protein